MTIRNEATGGTHSRLLLFPIPFVAHCLPQPCEGAERPERSATESKEPSQGYLDASPNSQYSESGSKPSHSN